MRESTREWCRWMNSEREWAAVPKVILGQLHFTALAPVPGSAALARLVPALELLRAGKLHVPALPLSSWLCQRADELPTAVRGVFDRGEIDAWMTFMATGIQTTCARQIELITRLDKVCDTTMLRKVWKKTAIVKLVEALISQPVINVIHIASICDVSSRRAKVLAKQLQEAGLAKVPPQDPRKPAGRYVPRQSHRCHGHRSPAGAPPAASLGSRFRRSGLTGRTGSFPSVDTLPKLRKPFPCTNGLMSSTKPHFLSLRHSPSGVFSQRSCGVAWLRRRCDWRCHV